MKLVQEVDGQRIGNESSEKKQPQGFKWISPKTGSFFFNRFTSIIYPVLFIVNLALLVLHPDLFPHYKDLFVFKLMLVNIPVWLMLTFFLVLIHEFGHILAIRAKNLSTKLEIGHRLFLVVFETDMSSVWKLSPKERNKLYFAGLCFDTLVLFIALFGQLAFSNPSYIIHGILRMVVLDTFIRMVYQLCVYMKTDLYYVFENSTGCYSLMENAQRFLREFFKLRKKNRAAGEAVFKGEEKIVYWYAIFYMAGVMITIILYVLFYIPQTIFALQKMLPGFQKPVASLSFWDSAVFSLQLLIGIILLAFSWIKKYREPS